MTPDADKTLQFFYTQLVIEWLDKHEYSRKHWLVMAKESKDQATEEVNAVTLLANSLESFHKKYRHAVVKDFNLLADILEHAFEKVDWIQVAESLLIVLDNKESTSE